MHHLNLFLATPQFHTWDFPPLDPPAVLGRESLTFTHQNTTLVSTTCHLVGFWVHQKKHPSAGNLENPWKSHLLHCFCFRVVFAFFWGPENIGSFFLHVIYISPFTEFGWFESLRIIQRTYPLSWRIHEENMSKTARPISKHRWLGKIGFLLLSGMLNCTAVDGWNPANQLTWSISHDLQGSKYIPRSAGFLPSTVSFIHLQITAAYQFFLGSWNHCCEKRKTCSVDVDSLGVFGTNSKSNLS